MEMTTNEDIKLVSPCGIYCGDCAVYRVKDNPALIPALLSNGLTEDQFPCPGCRAVEGMCPHLEGRCENFICATNHEVQMCFECGEFPCEKLHPAADRANSLPHNMKMYSQCYIKRYGVKAWIEHLPQIKLRYFTGKISFGKGPQLPGED
ncbi:MAG: hypothetical protein CVU49_05505 [Candidatus Cloacimonetes bacterium HGW-Cloacimonetes-2]|jgi:hypothetical protein|nr:MAG: hypothetical protein CVU49_05505 [Candidatus Cloacimonetes bacterium HGW-Cloacimonetes-2]